MLVCVACYLSVVGPILADDPKSPKRDFRIPTLMREAHMKGRQTYRALDQLLISGRSRTGERKQYAEVYTKLRDLTPPRGRASSTRPEPTQA